jgi:magnesium chelatase subunit D
VSEAAGEGNQAWADAAVAAALLVVDPAGLGGITLRAQAGPVRDEWLALLGELLPASMPLRRVPLHVTDERLLGGLDLAATLRTGRPVAERGLLAEANGGLLLLPMAERIAATAAARITAVLDLGEVALERDGLTQRLESRIGVVLLDEGASYDERPPAALTERLAFAADLTEVAIREVIDAAPDAAAVAAARARLDGISAGPELLEALCAAALALGIVSLRAPLFALRAARAAAALAGRAQVSEADAALAGRLVFAARATVLPAPPQNDQAEPEPPPEEPPEPPSDESASSVDKPLEDVVLDAAAAVIPPGLLAMLRAGSLARVRAQSAGRAGVLQKSRLRGRPTGSRAGEPRGGARLSLVETLRAAAPWQPLRRREVAVLPAVGRPRVQVRREDFRITRFKQRSQTTTLFVVDASGSAALHRLAEAKGAIELLLADCYVRRDQVAMIAFRGQGAELLLPPTRSLTRAKRSLAALPGGGGTPLAAGLDLALVLTEQLRGRGDSVALVVLTDGRANIARDGSHGRPQATADALAAARRLRALQVTALVVDTSPRPQPQAEQAAAEMGARYLPLPHADSARLSQAVRAVAGVGTLARSA